MEKELSEAKEEEKRAGGRAAVIEHDRRIRERKYESIPGDWMHGESESILG